MTTTTLVSTAALVAMAACSADPPSASDPEVAAPRDDAGPSARSDAGAGVDARADAGVDARADAGVDARAEGGGDAAGSDGGPPTPTVVEIRPEAFGAVADGATDSTAALQKALDAAVASATPSVVVLAKGTYRVQCPGVGGACLRLLRPGETSGPRVVVAGQGAAATRFVVGTPTMGLLWSSGVPLELRGFSVDYDPLPYTQGVVQRVSTQENALYVVVQAGFSDFNLIAPHLGSTFATIYEPQRPRLKGGLSSAWAVGSFSQVSPGVWRVVMASPLSAMTVAAGDRFVLPLRVATGITVAKGRDVVLSGVTVYSAPGIATVWWQNGGRLTLDGLSVRRAPDTARAISTNADAMHFYDNHATTIVRNSFIESMGDDAINTRSTPFPISAIPNASTLVIAPNGVTGFAPGQRLQVMSPAAQNTARGTARVVSATTDPATGQVTLRFAPPIANVQASDVVFDADLANPNILLENNQFATFRGLFRLRSVGAVLAQNVIGDPENALAVIGADIRKEWQEGPRLPGFFGGPYFAGNTSVAIGLLDGTGAKLGTASPDDRASLDAHPLAFDAEFYRAINPDLRGMTDADLARHWVNHGIAEGRRASADLCASEYLALHADLSAAFGAQNYREAIRHYVLGGAVREGRPGSVLTHALVFDPATYAAKNPDLAALGWTPGQLAAHWLTAGIDEGRTAHPSFSAAAYLGRYPDLAAAFGARGFRAAIDHYVRVGYSGGRSGT